MLLLLIFFLNGSFGRNHIEMAAMSKADEE